LGFGVWSFGLGGFGFRDSGVGRRLMDEVFGVSGRGTSSMNWVVSSTVVSPFPPLPGMAFGVSGFG